MPAPTKGKRLGGSPAHQKAILSNLATSLFEHGAITTTEAKARRLRPFAEKLISKAKRGDLHNRRQVMAVVRDKTVVHVLFTEIGPRYADRPGGYTRITKLGPRKGDNAPMAMIELVEEEFTSKARATKKATPAKTSTGARQQDAAAPVGPTVEETPVEETPVQETAVQETAVQEDPVQEDPVQEAPVDGATVNEPVPAPTQVIDDDQVEGQEAVAEQENRGDVPVAPQDETTQAANAPSDETSATDDTK